MKHGMTTTEGREARRRELARRTFEGQLSAEGLEELWDECEACATPYEATDREAPEGCPGLCGALCRALGPEGRWSRC